MDLSLEISSALRLLGNSTNFGQAEFKKVLQKATDDLINSGKVPVTSTGSGACDGADIFHNCYLVLYIYLIMLILFFVVDVWHY